MAKNTDEKIDIASKESFPASDAPSSWAGGVEKDISRKKVDKQTQVISGTTIDGEGGQGAMRSPLEREGDDIIDKNQIDHQKYQGATKDEDEHPERNPGVGQNGLANKKSK